MAYKKNCPECNGKSYGVSKKDWFCPYCGENLKNVQTEREKKQLKN